MPVTVAVVCHRSFPCWLICARSSAVGWAGGGVGGAAAVGVFSLHPERRVPTSSSMIISSIGFSLLVKSEKGPARIVVMKASP